MYMKRNQVANIAFAVGMGLVGFSHAESPLKYGPVSPEAQFVHKAGQGGIAEVELSEIAAQRSPSKEIRDFADHMVKAHTENNAKLKQIAQSENIPVPAEADTDHVAIRNKLSAATGSDIDRVYVQAMRRDHQSMLDLLDANANITDPKLHMFISETKPVVEHHLMMANKLTGP